MVNPQIRIDPDAIAILKEICSDPSEAIRKLKFNRLSQIELNEDYWNHMEALLKKHSRSPMEERVKPFQTVKKYGSIEKDEEYKEPVGKQGRQVR